MRLNVSREQIEVMNAVVEANFERRLAEHLRQNYADSVVKLPDGGEFTVGTLMAETLDALVRSGIARARLYELTFESSISSFVGLMFHVSPNFDQHRLCSVLLADEDLLPDERVQEIPKVLSENNWDAIREAYDPKAWDPPSEQEMPAEETVSAPAEKPPEEFAKTISNKTMSKTIGMKTRIPRAPQTPEVKEAPIDHLETIINIDVKE